MSVSRKRRGVSLRSYRSRTQGNAKIAGLTGDLGLTGVQFNLISALFYVRLSHFGHLRLIPDHCTPHRSRIALSKYQRKPPAASKMLNGIQLVAQEHGAEVLPAVQVE